MTPAPVPTRPKTDTLTYLLLAGTIFFALLVIAVDKLFPTESQAFQIIAGLAYGFAGAFFGRIPPTGHTPGASAIPGMPPQAALLDSGQAAAALQTAMATAPTPTKPPGMQP